MIYGLVVSMKIKQNGLWVNPPDNLQWRLNNQWHQASGGDGDDWVLATDADFILINGRLRYGGNDSLIELPNIINGALVTSYASMFNNATGIKGVRSTNTMITDMSSMFQSVSTPTLDLSELDTSNVTTMNAMFSQSDIPELDLSGFDTSSVTNMSNMFRDSQATSLDLSSFDTSNVTSMFAMFRDSQATIGYARTQADADRFNSSSLKPSTLNFVVKD